MEDKCKMKLGNGVSDKVTTMFESILDYAQVACPDPNTFKALRSKVLRAGNDCIRSVKSDLDNYNIKYISTKEDIIEIKK